MNIYAVGGYDQIGGNMSVVEVGDEAVILDMGLYLEPYIQYTDDLEFEAIKLDDLKKIGAVPDDNIILPIKKKIKAIVPSHAHLDHVGAIRLVCVDRSIAVGVAPARVCNHLFWRQKERRCDRAVCPSDLSRTTSPATR